MTNSTNPEESTTKHDSGDVAITATKVDKDVAASEVSQPAASGAPATAAGKKVIESFDRFERQLWESSPAVWFASLLAPLIITAVILATIYLVAGPAAMNRILLAATVTVFVLGRFIILVGQTGSAVPEVPAGDYWFGEMSDLSAISSMELFCMLTYMDMIVAGFLAFHLGFIFKVPIIGPRLADMIGDGQSLLEDHPWFKRLSFVGLVIFVIFPTSTTGSIGGSIVGRLMGLTRVTTFMAIATGSILGNTLMLLLANQINRYIGQDQWWVKAAGIGLCIAAVFLLERRYRHMQKIAKQEALDS